jgi:hypothetical protein
MNTSGEQYSGEVNDVLNCPMWISWRFMACSNVKARPAVTAFVCEKAKIEAKP